MVSTIFTVFCVFFFFLEFCVIATSLLLSCVCNSVLCALASASAVRLRAIFTRVAPCWLAMVSSCVCVSSVLIVGGGGAVLICMLVVLVCSSLPAARRRYHKSYFSMSGLPTIMSYGKLRSTRKVKGTCSAWVSFLFLLSLHFNVPLWDGMVIIIFMQWEDI